MTIVLPVDGQYISRHGNDVRQGLLGCSKVVLLLMLMHFVLAYQPLYFCALLGGRRCVGIRQVPGMIHDLYL